MIGRRQLPVHSPLTLGAVGVALGASDERPALAAALRAHHGSADVILLSSGTGALTLALQAASRARPGLPCALPGYACYDLISAAVAAGVRLRLYDLDPSTLAPDPGSLARALAGGAAALVVVHLFGIAVPMDTMRDAADRAGALLIEDAAQGTGASWNDRPLGAWGDLGVLSFGRGKGETGGGGGALLLRDAALVPDVLREAIAPSSGGTLEFSVKLAAQWALGRPWLYAVPASMPMLRLGQTIYKPPAPLEVMHPASARVLKQTRPLAADEADRRRAHAMRLRRAMTGAFDAITPADARGAGYLRFPVVPRRPIMVDAHLARLGVLRGYPVPLADLPASADLLEGVPSLPGAERLARALVTLPTHGQLSERDLRALERWLSLVS